MVQKLKCSQTYGSFLIKYIFYIWLNKKEATRYVICIQNAEFVPWIYPSRHVPGDPELYLLRHRTWGWTMCYLCSMGFKCSGLFMPGLHCCHRYMAAAIIFSLTVTSHTYHRVNFINFYEWVWAKQYNIVSYFWTPVWQHILPHTYFARVNSLQALFTHLPTTLLFLPSCTYSVIFVSWLLIRVKYMYILIST